MKRINLMLFVILLGAVLLGESAFRQVSAGPEISTEKLVGAIRLLNTHEVSYRHENGRYADRGQMLIFLRQNGLLSESPVALENPNPYELAITTSSDGMHYQVTLQRPSEMNDKSTWCRTAAFSDDKGIIFLGQALDCEEEVVYPTPETQSAFFKNYSPASTIARFRIEGSGAQQSAPGGSSAGRGCAFHKKEFVSLCVIASGNSAPLMAEVERDIRSSLSQQDARIIGEAHAEGFQFDYSAGRSIGTVVVDPIVVVDATSVAGPHGGIAPGEIAVKLRIRIAETWYKGTCGSL